MSDSHDSGAAGRVRGFLDWQDDSDLIASAYDENEGVRTLEVDDLRAVLAENDAMRRDLAGVRRIAEEWGGEPTSADRFLANAILAIVVEPASDDDEPWPDEPLSWRWWREPTEHSTGAMACNGCGTGVVVFEDYTSDRLRCRGCGKKGRNGPPTGVEPADTAPVARP